MGPQRLSRGVEPTRALLTYPKAPGGAAVSKVPTLLLQPLLQPLTPVGSLSPLSTEYPDQVSPLTPLKLSSLRPGSE